MYGVLFACVAGIQLAHRPHLNAAVLCRRNAEILRIDEIEAGKQLLGRGERAIIELHLPVADTHGRRRVHRM